MSRWKRGSVLVGMLSLLVGLLVVGTGFSVQASVAPVPTVKLKCGGWVTFGNVPQGWYAIVEPGDHLYPNTGSVTIGPEALTPGSYTYEFRNPNAEDQTGGSFTIVACPKPSPEIERLKCGGWVQFGDVPDEWFVVVEPGDHLFRGDNGNIGPKHLAPGTYTYEFRNAAKQDQVGGRFTIRACPRDRDDEDDA